METEFEPRKHMAKRYSLQYMAKQRGMTVEELALEMDKQIKDRQDMIKKYISQGMTAEQARTHVYRCLYLNGFSGTTFKD